jgi:hypothetical protein
LVWFAAGLVISTVTLGCGGDDNNRHTGKHEIWFMGAVVDGATGAPIATYDITLVSGTTTIKGKVDATTHRFTVGPLQAWNDYGILIDNPDYRHFSSYNGGIAPPTLGANSTTSDIYSSDTTQTFNFNASLFPTAVKPPDITIAVIETGVMPKAATGTIRLQPTSQPTLVAQPSEVQGQSWANDNDLYAAALSASFSNGTYTATGTNLVYGVSYTVTVYGVDGYQPTNNNNQVTVQAGVTTASQVLLVQQTVPPPQAVSNTSATCRAPAALTDASSAMVVISFNEDVEDGTTTPGGGAEVLDNGIQVTFSMFTSTLATSLSSTMQERGTSFAIAGNTLTLGWNPNLGIATKGTGDTVRSVTYGGLGGILIQPKGRPDLRTPLNQALANAPLTPCAAP